MEKTVKDMLLKPLFIMMSPDTVREILSSAKQFEVKKGETILHQNDPGNSFFIIKSGSVIIQIEKNGIPPDKKITTLYGDDTMHHQYEGDFFGEMSLLDFAPRSASVIANEDCVLLEICGEVLSKIFKKSPKDHIIFLSNIARILSRRLRRTLEKIKN